MENACAKNYTLVTMAEHKHSVIWILVHYLDISLGMLAEKFTLSFTVSHEILGDLNFLSTNCNHNQK